MSSPCRGMGNPARYNVMFWLPPGGIDNEIFAA